MRILFFGAADARTQIKNYSCRRSRGLISGRGFDSPRLHHYYLGSGRLSGAKAVTALRLALSPLFLKDLRLVGGG